MMGQDDEIKALRKANDSLLGQIRGLTAKVERLEAEVEPMRAQRTLLLETLDNYESERARAWAELREEVKL